MATVSGGSTSVTSSTSAVPVITKTTTIEGVADTIEERRGGRRGSASVGGTNWDSASHGVDILPALKREACPSILRKSALRERPGRTAGSHGITNFPDGNPGHVKLALIGLGTPAERSSTSYFGTKPS